MILDALSNATYCVSLHGPGVELDGGVQTPPGPARSAPSTGTGPARANPRPAVGAESAPSWFFRITIKPLQISTQNLLYLILHQCYIECPILIEIVRIFFLKNRCFGGSFHANFDQNRLNVRKCAKNKVLKQVLQKEQHRCKTTRSTKWQSRKF